MNLKLTPEQERMIRDELESGHFQTADQVISEALLVLREKARTGGTAVSDGRQREAVREMLAFVEKNRVPMHDVSVKELIREGHRL